MFFHLLSIDLHRGKGRGDKKRTLPRKFSKKLVNKNAIKPKIGDPFPLSKPNYRALPQKKGLKHSGPSPLILNPRASRLLSDVVTLNRK